MNALLWLGGILGGCALVWLIVNFLLNKMVLCKHFVKFFYSVLHLTFPYNYYII